jgi:hypothetical protein
MSEIDETPRTYSGALLAVLAVSLLAAIAGLVWCGVLGSKLTSQQSELADAKQDNVKLAAELRETNARLSVTTDELSKSLGLTQKQLDDRASEIIRREQADNQKLQSAQQQTAQQVSAVSSDLSTVKTDVGGVHTDLSKAQTDVATALSQLESVKGDLSNTNSVIARNHDELVTLEHKGDRNYYEFGQGPEEAGGYGKPGAEEDRPEEEQIYARYLRRRQDLRKERPERERTPSVLQRQGSGPLRDRGELDQHKERDQRVPHHAQVRACSTHRGAQWAIAQLPIVDARSRVFPVLLFGDRDARRKRQAGLITESESEVQIFSSVPILFADVKSGDNRPFHALAGLDGGVERQSLAVRNRHGGVSQEDALVISG